MPTGWLTLLQKELQTVPPRATADSQWETVYFLLVHHSDVWHLLWGQETAYDPLRYQPLIYDFRTMHLCKSPWGAGDAAVLVGYTRERLLLHRQLLRYIFKSTKEMKRVSDPEETESESDEEDVEVMRPWMEAYAHYHGALRHKTADDLSEYEAWCTDLEQRIPSIACEHCRRLVREIANIYRHTIASLPAGQLRQIPAPNLDVCRSVHTWHAWRQSLSYWLQDLTRLPRELATLVVGFCASYLSMLTPTRPLSAGFWWQTDGKSIRTFVRDYHPTEERLLTLEVGKDVCPLDWLAHHGLPWDWFFVQAVLCSGITVPSWSTSPICQEARVFTQLYLGGAKPSVRICHVKYSGELALFFTQTAGSVMPISSEKAAVVDLPTDRFPWLARLFSWPAEPSHRIITLYCTGVNGQVLVARHLYTRWSECPGVRIALRGHRHLALDDDGKTVRKVSEGF